MKDKKLSELTVNDVAKLGFWFVLLFLTGFIGIPLLIAFIVNSC